MYSFLPKLFKKDPEAVDKRLVRRYMKLSARRHYHLRVSGDKQACIAAFEEMEHIANTANEATLIAIQEAVESRGSWA